MNDNAVEVADAEVVDTGVIVEPGHTLVSAAMQIIITPEAKTMYRMHESLVGIQSTLMTHTEHLEDISGRVMQDIESIDSLDILYDIQKILNKRIQIQAVEVSFMKVTEMAQNLSVSKSFLEKNMGEIFIEGTHYTRAVDARLVRWNVEKMHQWMKGEDRDETDKQLLSKLLD